MTYRSSRSFFKMWQKIQESLKGGMGIDKSDYIKMLSLSYSNKCQIKEKYLQNVQLKKDKH